MHEGFLKAWDEIGETVFNAVKSASMRYPDYTIVATGHSLGAAVATLGAADLRISGFAVDLFTYGSPRVGNGVFADFVTRQPGLHYRVTHLDDMVPRLPPLMLGYRHAGIEYWLWNGTAKTTAYTAADVKICTGDANEDCNGGQHGHDSTAHAYYLEKMSGCDPDGGQGKTILHEVLNGLNVASDVADLLDLGDVLFRGREHKIIP